MLKDMYNDFVRCASILPGFKPLSKNECNDITELANGYCDAEEAGDDILMEANLSALMVRYWHMVIHMYDHRDSVLKRLEVEDFVPWLYEAFMKGFKYRRWRDPSNPLSKDKNGPEKVFNQCLTSVIGWYYNHYNKQKRKANYTCDSLDSYLESAEGDGPLTQLDALGVEEPRYTGICEDIITNYLKSDKVVEAIIVDGIAYQNPFKETTHEEVEEYVDDEGNTQKVAISRVDHQFSKRQLRAHLETLDAKFVKYFSNKYSVNSEIILKTASELRSCGSKQINKYIDKTLKSIASNAGALGLC